MPSESRTCSPSERAPRGCLERPWTSGQDPPPPLVQQTIKSSKNMVRTEVFVGHGGYHNRQPPSIIALGAPQTLELPPRKLSGLLMQLDGQRVSELTNCG